MHFKVQVFSYVYTRACVPVPHNIPLHCRSLCFWSHSLHYYFSVLLFFNIIFLSLAVQKVFT